jgi:hypothetical protein
MASKTEGAAAIAHLEGKKLRNRVVKVVEALPLDKGKKVTSKTRSNRLNKRRERKYQMI